MRLSPKSDAGPNYYNLGLSAGVLPFENVKLEVGMDYLTTGFQNDNQFDNHPSILQKYIQGYECYKFSRNTL
jgi:hypothetical protein